MASKDVEVFAVCATESIEPGCAKAFNLLRFNEAGESRPFPIVIIRTSANDYFGYVNACPHNGIWLNFGAGGFFSPDRAFVECGRHGSKFEIETGRCIDGPCKARSLEPVALAVVDGDICLSGRALAIDDGFPDRFEELEDNMATLIHLY